MRLLLLALLLASCTVPPKSAEDVTQPPVVLPPPAYSVPGFKPEWTAEAAKALEGSALLAQRPKDQKFYASSCKDAKTFWLALMGALAKFESNYNPREEYVENFTDAKGQRVRSRGLFQMSIESANAYGCGFKNADELFDPALNIRCFVKTAGNLVSRDSLISGGEKVAGKQKWYGLARYWSPFRDAAKLRSIRAAAGVSCQ